MHNSTIKKIRALTLAVVMCFSLGVTAFAADSTTGTSAVDITADGAVFTVTVPTTLPVYMDAAGAITYASDVKIVNGSSGAIKVSGLAITGKNSWVTVDYDTANMAAEKVGSTKIAFEINGEKTTGADTVSFVQDNWAKIDGVNEGATDEMAITYSAKLPAQKTALTAVNIADIVFTVIWDE